MPDFIFIPEEVPSKKNSRRILYKFNKGKRIPFIGASARYKKWQEKVSIHFAVNKSKFLYLLTKVSSPYYIGIHFIRKRQGPFDFNNISQGILDLMVQHQWITDDNVKIILPIPLKNKDGASYTIDKKQPGTIIMIIKTLQIEYV